jgi:hypothetical protein
MPILSKEFVRGLPIPFDTVYKFARGLPIPLTHLQEGCPNNIQRVNLCAIPMKKVKFKVENHEATGSF